MAEQPGDPRRVPADGGAALLREALELLLSVPAADLSPQDSLARTDAVLLARAQLRAVELDGVRDLDTRELYALGEAGSVRTWLGQRAYAAAGGPRLRLARRLASSPSATAALRTGAVGSSLVERALGVADQLPAAVVQAAEAGESGDLDVPGRPAVEPAVAKETAERLAAVLADGIPMVIGRVADDDAVRAECRALAESLHLPVVERLVAGFLVVARHVAPGQYRACVRDLVEALLPQPEPGDDASYAKRNFTLTRLFDGWWRADGDLAPEVGARLHAELDAELAARATYDAAQAAAADAAGESTGPNQSEPTDPEATNPEATDDEATDAEATDAEPVVADGATATATDVHPVPSAAAQRHDALAALLFNRAARPAATPMTIVISADRLLDEPGALAARTADGHPVTDAAVGAAFCSTRITALITGARRQPLDLYRTRRDADTHQRRALNATWGPTCAALGCGNPGVIPHHVLPWHLDGQTNTEDLRPVCASCHDDIHLGGRTITLRDGTAIGPSGWVRRPPPTPGQTPLRG